VIGIRMVDLCGVCRLIISWLCAIANVALCCGDGPHWAYGLFAANEDRRSGRTHCGNSVHFNTLASCCNKGLCGKHHNRSSWLLIYASMLPECSIVYMFFICGF